MYASTIPASTPAHGDTWKRAEAALHDFARRDAETKAAQRAARDQFIAEHGDRIRAEAAATRARRAALRAH